MTGIPSCSNDFPRFRSNPGLTSISSETMLTGLGAFGNLETKC